MFHKDGSAAFDTRGHRIASDLKSRTGDENWCPLAIAGFNYLNSKLSFRVSALKERLSEQSDMYIYY